MKFIDEHKGRFGVVQSICRVLCEHGWQIAPSGYWAAKKRPPSARGLRDEQLLKVIYEIRGEDECWRNEITLRRLAHGSVREDRSSNGEVAGDEPVTRLETALDDGAAQLPVQLHRPRPRIVGIEKELHVSIPGGRADGGRWRTPAHVAGRERARRPDRIDVCREGDATVGAALDSTCGDEP